MSGSTHPIPTNLTTPAIRPVAALELHAFAAWQAQRGLSERTIKERALMLARLSAPFTTERIEAFLGATGLSRNTRATYWTHCAAYAKWLLVSGRADRNPMDRLMAPRRIPTEARPLADAQIEAMLGVAERHRTRVMILLAAFAGMRVSEIAAMRGDWVDLWTNTLTITGKGGATRSIPLHEVLREVSQSMPRREYWFPSYEKMGPPKPHVTRSAVHAAISGAMYRTGIYGSTPHQLRHWYGTRLLEGGVDIRVVQVLMRHRSIASTQIYTRVPREHLDHGIATLRLTGIARPDEPPEAGAAA